MKFLIKFTLFSLESDNNYDKTSWTNNGITVTIHDVQKFLDDINEPVIEIPVDKIKNMCVHIDKTDYKTLQRSENSDLYYPIIITKNEKGLKMILDGHHRLLKAINHNITTIKSRILDLTRYDIPIEFKKVFD